MAQQPVVSMTLPYMAVNAPAGYGFFGTAPQGAQPAAAYGAHGALYPVQNGMPVTYVDVGRPAVAHQVPQHQQQSHFGTWTQSTPVANPFMVCFMLLRCHIVLIPSHSPPIVLELLGTYKEFVYYVSLIKKTYQL